MLGKAVDGLFRRYNLHFDDFFSHVIVRDCTRAKRQYIEDQLELPKSHITSYLPEGIEVAVQVEDITQGRMEEKKAHLSYFANLRYRNDDKEIITLTIGNQEPCGLDRNQIRILQDSREQNCGMYSISVEAPLPQNLEAENLEEVILS